MKSFQNIFIVCYIGQFLAHVNIIFIYTGRFETLHVKVINIQVKTVYNVIRQETLNKCEVLL